MAEFLPTPDLLRASGTEEEETEEYLEEEDEREEDEKPVVLARAAALPAPRKDSKAKEEEIEESLKRLRNQGKYVKLNVGGSLYCTTLGTLTKHDNMLRAMFSGRMELETDDEGTSHYSWKHTTSYF